MNDPTKIYISYQKKNRCYLAERKATPVGILMHSTGAVNTKLSRYVDDEEHLGTNAYGNHWNRPEVSKCMHAFLGKDKDGEPAVAQTLPYAYACWGCGKGSKGSYNYDPTAHIQFEICQGSNTDADYYHAAIALAEEYCAYLCRLYGWSAEAICSHREAARAGYASNHGDPESWMKHFGDDMDAFRQRVQRRLDGGETLYAVHIRHLTQKEAEALRSDWPDRAEVGPDE